MADEEDYLSDKFLFGSTATTSSSSTKTYSDRRKEAQRKAQHKNEANRRKTRKQIHDEELREGLSTSLFEKAQAERETLGAENKAMSMMMKMGFKLGDSLGKKEQQQQSGADELSAQVAKPPASPSPGPPSSANLSTEREQGRAEQQHRKVPLSINIWEGKKYNNALLVAMHLTLIVVPRRVHRIHHLFSSHRNTKNANNTTAFKRDAIQGRKASGWGSVQYRQVRSIVSQRLQRWKSPPMPVRHTEAGLATSL